MKENAEQQEIAFRDFVRNIEKLIKILKDGHSLSELSEDCTKVCESDCIGEFCNMNRWILLLCEAEKNELIPYSSIAFLEYLVEAKRSKRWPRLKRWFFGIIFEDFEIAKTKIIYELSLGFSLPIIYAITREDGSKDSTLFGWLHILMEAESFKIIPGDNLLNFLRFI